MPFNAKVNRLIMNGWKSEIDIVAEPIRAYRTWTINNAGDLCAIAMHVPWDGPEMEAACETGRSHESPDPHCACGLWGLKTLEQARGYSYGPRYAYGEIEMWGRVLEGQIGYRSQHARPVKVFLDTDLSKRTANYIREKYNCEVILVDGLDYYALGNEFVNRMKHFALLRMFVFLPLICLNVAIGYPLDWFSIVNFFAAAVMVALFLWSIKEYKKYKKLGDSLP